MKKQTTETSSSESNDKSKLEQYHVPGDEPPLQLLDEERRQKIDEFRKFVEEEIEMTKAQQKWVTDSLLYRYLRARNWKFADAKDMLANTLQWREEYKPHKIKAKEVESNIRRGQLYHYKHDKFGRPALYVKVNTDHDPHSTEQKFKFMIHAQENAIRHMDEENGVEKMIWLVACKGYSYKHNGEVGFARELISILANHYPERLGVLFLYDAPFVFRAFWKLVAPWIDRTTLKKVQFMPSGESERRKMMEQYFDLKDLRKEFGGDDEFCFDADEYIAAITKLEEEEEAEREREEAEEEDGEKEEKKQDEKEGGEEKKDKRKKKEKKAKKEKSSSEEQKEE
ncbi:Doublecortin domain-containing protein 2-like [Balamuthia mandrillaris]